MRTFVESPGPDGAAIDDGEVAAREAHRKDMLAAYEELLAHEAAERLLKKQAEAARAAG